MYSVEQKVEREEVAKVTGTNKDDVWSESTEEARRRTRFTRMIRARAEAVKKYKQCCGRKT